MYADQMGNGCKGTLSMEALSKGIGPIHKINGIMDRFMFRDILKDVMFPYAGEEMPLKQSKTYVKSG